MEFKHDRFRWNYSRTNSSPNQARPWLICSRRPSLPTDRLLDTKSNRATSTSAAWHGDLPWPLRSPRSQKAGIDRIWNPIGLPGKPGTPTGWYSGTSSGHVWSMPRPVSYGSFSCTLKESKWMAWLMDDKACGTSTSMATTGLLPLHVEHQVAMANPSEKQAFCRYLGILTECFCKCSSWPRTEWFPLMIGRTQTWRGQQSC